jgi:hypothetical protein
MHFHFLILNNNSMKKLFALLLFLCIFFDGTAQKRQGPKVDPYIKMAIKASKEALKVKEKNDKAAKAFVNSSKKALKELGVVFEEENTLLNALIKYTGTPDALASIGINIRTRYKDVYSADVPLSSVEALKELDGFQVIELSNCCRMS